MDTQFQAKFQPHQQRVVDEKTALDEKIEKLRAFFNTAIFANLHPDEQERLRIQFGYMVSYSSILEERIKHF